ncbi:MAG TPA: Fur family transcriptional regulator [Candidatus Sulfomarinibacteraceae bacterium]|nr:Fur family transcriptional regulator [Candidatus Sulfomarinibacteraceae bacterium]
MPEKTHDSNLLAERLRAAGLRLTPQRLAIYRTLAATDRHPTAQQLYEQLQDELPSLSQATVYNTLQALVERGLVHEIGDAGDGAVHYDADLAPHLNLVCIRCHRIDDFHSDLVTQTDRAVAQESGYRLRGARLVYYGLCPACQAESDGNSERK